MYKRNMISSIFTFLICLPVSYSLASGNIFYGQSIKAEPLAIKLGIEKQIFYSSEKHPLVYRSSVDAVSLETIQKEKVEALHQDIRKLISDSTSREPDAIHLHLDHKHNDAGKFISFFDDLEKYAKANNLTISNREDSNSNPSNFPPIERESLIEVLIGSPDSMRKLINHAVDTYQKYINSNSVNISSTCLLIHPQYSIDEENLIDQYFYHYQHVILLSNPNNCNFSYNYAAYIKDRLINQKKIKSLN